MKTPGERATQDRDAGDKNYRDREIKNEVHEFQILSLLCAEERERSALLVTVSAVHKIPDSRHVGTGLTRHPSRLHSQSLTSPRTLARWRLGHVYFAAAWEVSYRNQPT